MRIHGGWRSRVRLGLGTLAAPLGLVLAAGPAAAEPFTVDGQVWQHQAGDAADTFTRADGAVVTFAAFPGDCAARPRTSPIERPPWVPPAYWPVAERADGRLVLCLTIGAFGGAATATVTPGRGDEATTAGLLRQVAEQARPPTDLPELGLIHPSLPVALARGSVLGFRVGELDAGLGIQHADHGTCAFDQALVVSKLGHAVDRSLAPGYWPMVFDSDSASYGCLELRDGYLSVIANPPGQVGALADVLAEIRRAAYARHGAPLSTADGPVTLARAGRAVTVGGAGTWKVVDGGRYGADGADVLASTAPLGDASTMYAIAVGPGCAAGTAPAPAEVAAALFPWATGPVWIDPEPIKLRWRGWTCVGTGADQVTVSVVAALAHDAPPGPRDVLVLSPALTAVAGAWGGAAAAPAWSAPPGHRGSRPLRGAVTGYLGVLSLAPPGGERRTGGLVGTELRLAVPAIGFALAGDLELGWAGGELVGELRFGGGLALGGFDAVVGASVGSTGPGAGMDVYGQLGLAASDRLWLGALHAIGVGGPDHDQLDLHLLVPGKGDTALYLGARATWYGDTTDDTGASHDHGSALLVTFGGAVVPRR